MNQITAAHKGVPVGSERSRLRDGVHIEVSPRRVRAVFDHEPLADFFRLEDGKVVEHWDVIQSVPNAAKNDNGMF